MRTLPISAAKAKLNELVDEAVSTREHITITRNGTPAAVVVSADEWESLQETLFWMSQPGIRDDIAQARSDAEAGRVISAQEMRRRYGLDS